MEDKVLYNVLKKVGSGKERDAAPDENYLKSLETIGIIKSEWEGNYLTDLGKTIYQSLQRKFEKW